jgi:hypothetical protein
MRYPFDLAKEPKFFLNVRSVGSVEMLKKINYNALLGF